jgi:hypothetical protein
MSFGLAGKAIDERPKDCPAYRRDNEQVKRGNARQQRTQSFVGQCLCPFNEPPKEDGTQARPHTNHQGREQNEARFGYFVPIEPPGQGLTPPFLGCLNVQIT